jgi:hypothetical protein
MKVARIILVGFSQACDQTETGEGWYTIEVRVQQAWYENAYTMLHSQISMQNLYLWRMHRACLN